MKQHVLRAFQLILIDTLYSKLYNIINIEIYSGGKVMAGTVLDLSALPDSARGEVIDFYEFLKIKFQNESRVKDKINWSKFV